MQSDTNSYDSGSSHFSSDLKHKANNTLRWFMIVKQQAGLNGCCTSMWKQNGEIITLLHFLYSSISKTERTDDLKEKRGCW
jgi:hypothetical protein